MAAINVPLGNALPLSLTIINGTSGLFPQAEVRDSAGAAVAGSPFDLAEVGATGRYTSVAFVPTIEDIYSAHYITYTDAGHLTESVLHGRAEDQFEVNDLAGAISRIATSGGSINDVADSVTVVAGTPAGVVANTFAVDGVYHQVAEAAGAINVIYDFVLPPDGVPAAAIHHGRVDRSGGAVSTLPVQAWNWVTSGWDGIGLMLSVNNSTILDDATMAFPLLPEHVGTLPADLGKVRIRFVQTGYTRSEELFTDQLLVGYVIVFRSVGYAQGKIWIDTINGAAGTTPFFNGVADNPVNSLADATTLAGLLGIRRFAIAPSNIITLAATYDEYTFTGVHWFLNLGGQSIQEAGIQGAEVNGIAAAAAGLPHFEGCGIQVASLPSCHLHNSILAGTLTLLDAGFYHFDDCSSGVAGVATPVIDFGVAVGVTDLNMRHYSGGVETENMKAGDLMSLEGDGQLIINANCTGGTIAVRGHFRITDNSGGAVTIVKDDITDAVAAVLLDTAAIDARLPPDPADESLQQASHAQTQADIAALNDIDPQGVRDAMKLTPAGGAPAAGSVDEHLDDILADTAAIEPLVSANLDATVSSRESAAAAAVRETNILAAIAALNDLSQADVQAAMTAQGYTTGRAAFLDRLDATVSSRATQTSVDAIQNVTRVAISIPKFVIPDSGSIDYLITLNMFDTAGNPEDPDSNQIDVTAENQAGSSRMANLGGAPVGRMTRIATGRYQIMYTVSSAHAIEQLILRFTYLENAVSFTQDRVTNAVSTVEDNFTALDRADLQAVLADTAVIEPLVSLNLDAAITSVLAAIAALNDLDSSDVDAAITANAVIVLLRKTLTNRRVTNPSTGRLEIWNDADSAVEFSVPIYEDVGESQAYRGQGIDVQRKIV